MSQKAAGQPRMERELNMSLLTPLRGLSSLVLAGATTLSLAGTASAEALQQVGAPVPEGIGFQPAATPIAVQAQGLEHMILWIVGVIVVFVCALLLYVMLRFNSRSNPTPAKFTHNTPLEVAWTLVPILILVFIGSFSLPALFDQVEIPKADMTIKVTGNQWYWHYDYPEVQLADGSPLGFDSVLLEKDKLEAAGYKPTDYLLAVDNALVVPVGKIVKVEMTGADVIHAWAVPAFAVMHSAVPGRLGETWFRADKEGIYFGQCTTLCGQGHAYMPIEVKVVSQEAYDKWVEQAKTGNYQLASN